MVNGKIIDCCEIAEAWKYVPFYLISAQKVFFSSFVHLHLS